MMREKQFQNLVLPLDLVAKFRVPNQRLAAGPRHCMGTVFRNYVKKKHALRSTSYLLYI